jgi:protoheme IX farnesyltransferase
MSGLIYLASAMLLGARFLYYAIRLKRDDGIELPMRVFRYSINYLMILFAALLVDHYFIIRLGL